MPPQSVVCRYDRRYKNKDHAVRKADSCSSNRTLKVDEEDTSADFSREKPVVAALEQRGGNLNTPDWESKVNADSAIFKTLPEFNGYGFRSHPGRYQYVVNWK